MSRTVAGIAVTQNATTAANSIASVNATSRAGDFRCTILWIFSNTVTSDTPVGWNSIPEATDNGSYAGIRQYCFTRFQTGDGSGGNPANQEAVPTFTFSASVQFGMATWTARNVHTTNPFLILPSAANQNGGDTLTTPFPLPGISMTPNDNGGMAAWVYGVKPTTSASTMTVTLPAGIALAGGQARTGSTAGFTMRSGADVNLAPNVPTGTRVANAAATAPWRTTAFMLRGAPSNMSDHFHHLAAA